jgi:hypothetical protein
MEGQTGVPETVVEREPGFEVRISGKRVELVIPRPGDEALPPTAKEIFAALADLPLETYASERVDDALKRADGSAVPLGEVGPLNGAADWEIVVSPSRLAAYIVPTSSTSVSVVATDILTALGTAGVTHGILDDVLAGSSAAAPFEAATLVARGAAVTPCVNARVEYLFDPSPTVTPVLREDGSVDHHGSSGLVSADIGTAIARLHGGIAGKAGFDVFGDAIDPPAPTELSLANCAGKGVEVRGDTLVASQPGRPVIIAGKVEVLSLYEVKGDVNYAVGSINFNGDVVVGGDVHPGFSIRAGGSVKVRGVVDHANVSAAHDLDVGGIRGDGTTVIEVGGSMRAQYLHNAIVRVGGVLIVNREIVACTVSAAKVQTPANGRIVGGEVTAREEISAGSLGSMQGVVTHLTALEGTEKVPPVVRAAKQVHAGIEVTIGHRTLKLRDDGAGASFWNVKGEISWLGPAATMGKVA